MDLWVERVGIGQPGSIGRALRRRPRAAALLLPSHRCRCRCCLPRLPLGCRHPFDPRSPAPSNGPQRPSNLDRPALPTGRLGAAAASIRVPMASAQALRQPFSSLQQPPSAHRERLAARREKGAASPATNGPQPSATALWLGVVRSNGPPSREGGWRLAMGFRGEQCIMEKEKPLGGGTTPLASLRRSSTAGWLRARFAAGGVCVEEE